MMAIGDFAVVTDYWKRKDGKKIEVSYYVEKEYENYARNIFGETPNMILTKL
jgi:aminopeptidase N